MERQDCGVSLLQVSLSPVASMLSWFLFQAQATRPVRRPTSATLSAPSSLSVGS